MPWLVVRRVGAPVVQWWTRAAAWSAAVVLTGYGALLTAVGLAVRTGLIRAAADADHHALAWHAFVWDPWFLLWGLAAVVALSAPVRRGRRPPRETTELPPDVVEREGDGGDLVQGVRPLARPPG